MGTQQFCLKWNNHQANMVTIFEQLLSTEALVDVTLACDGLSLRAHKMVLSACSPYFQSLFIENPCKHPIVIMKDMRYTELKAIIDFMYRGEVNVSHDQLNALLRTAETLKVKGLAEVCGERTNSGIVQQEVVQQNATSAPVVAATSHVQTRSDSPTLLSKRKRGRPRKRSLSDSNRSDDEQVPSKIKQPESPEIEELSADASLDASEVSQNIGGSNSQTLVPVSVHNSLRTSIQPSQEPQIEEPPECEFEVEPSKLMEQTLSTADVPVISKSTTQITSSVHTSSSGPDVHNRSVVPSGDSQSLISASVSIASDSLGSSQMQGPDSPQDIKPALLTFEEPPISPVAGTSQENSSMLMYVDPSGVPAIPGTSYQQDSQGTITQDSQQGLLDQSDEHFSPASGNKHASKGKGSEVTHPQKVHKSWSLNFSQAKPPKKHSNTSADTTSVPSQQKSLPSQERLTDAKRKSQESSFTPGPSNETVAENSKLPPELKFCDAESVNFDERIKPRGEVGSVSSDHTMLPLVCISKYVDGSEKQLYIESSLLSPSLLPSDIGETQNAQTSVVVGEQTFENQPMKAKCPHCPFFADDLPSFRSHLIHTHSGRDKTKCPLCSKRFASKGSLYSHLYRHTGEKPFICDSCTKKFVSKFALAVHVKKHCQK